MLRKQKKNRRLSSSASSVSSVVDRFSTYLAAILVVFSVSSTQAQTPSLYGELRIMAGPVAQNITDRSATIFWLTSREAPMELRYGLSQTKLDQHGSPEPPAAAANGNQEHRVVLKNLQPDENYFFEIVDSDGAARARGQFQTEPSEYAQIGRLRIVDGPVFEYLDSSSVEIAWTTSAQSSTLIRYGIDPNDLRKTAQAPWGEETHRIQLTGLDPNTTYYFVVESAQARDSGTMAKSAEGAFRTEYQGEAALTHIEPRR